MRVSLMKNDKKIDLILPEQISGSYWITDLDKSGNRKNLISIEAVDNTWHLVSNDDIYVMNNNLIEPYKTLVNNEFTILKNKETNENIILYCSSVLQKYNCYDINSYIEDGFNIGPLGVISSPVLNNVNIVVRKEHDDIVIINDGSKAPIYVNDVRLEGKRKLKNADIVFTQGVMFFIVKKQDVKNVYYLYLNNVDINISAKLTMTKLVDNQSDTVEEKDEIDIPLYEDSDYFHKTPRFIPKIKTLNLSVDAPPSKQEDKDQSILLTIGPMLTMSMTSLVSGYVAVNNVLSGSSTIKSALPSIIMCVAMFASIFIWPTISRRVEARNRKKKEKERQKKYGAYIESKKLDIQKAIDQQSSILNNNYPSIKDCEQIVLNKYTTLWQRRIEDDDYLVINLGVGSYPMKIDIKYPEEHFSLFQDNLKDMVQSLGAEPKLLPNVPIIYSLYDNYITGIIGSYSETSKYLKNVILQCVTHHSYDNLKIVIFTDEEKQKDYEYLSFLPHLFTDDKELRLYATNNDEYKEICYYLDREFNKRSELTKELTKEDLDYTYLIITDSFKAIRNYDVINNIIKSKKNLGFSIVILDKNITDLPTECKSFISIKDGTGEMHANDYYIKPLKFEYDKKVVIDYDKIVNKLANIPIERQLSKDGKLPNKLGFLEMFDVGKIEQLNSINRWKNNNPILNLQAPVGYGKNTEKISIDLHEKYHGPHGLIAGSTGSGKSEFIITYILSMAVNYHPYEVQFILIDYKGGGLAGAFENKVTGLKLPHLVGTITNLDANEIKRSLASIESELKRRQSLFNKAREISGESTIDIYKYQKMYRDKIVNVPISHLFIICDEFAELKTQQPDFMQQLISTARIGRSLGVHLILATQKPSGVVDPQIWSNTRFRVCMRVQEKSDSNEVIKCPDAAYLKQTGRFYFQVGYNEVFVLGQAAWAGGKYIPREKVKKNIDTNINFINNIGYIYKNIETKEKEINVKSNGEELINIVKYLQDQAESLNIVTTPLWLEKIKDSIRIEDLALKYKYTKENFVINPIIGEYDVPKKQEQRLLTLPISKEGNTLVYGASGSGKENFVTTLIYSSMLYYSAKELNYYIVDYGSGSLNIFKDSSIVGDIVTPDDTDKLSNLFKLLQTNIDERKKLFQDYNGDYYNYCKNSGSTLPSIIVIINNFEAFTELSNKYEDILNSITRDCNKYGIYFVILSNTPNGVRFKLKQNFSLIYALSQNNDDDFTTILGNIYKTYPSKIFGRGIFKTDDVYEFQTCLVTEKDDIPRFIKAKCMEYRKNSTVFANKIPMLPNCVTYNDIATYLDSKNYIIGLNKENLEIKEYDFNKNAVSIITGTDINQTENLVNPLINQIVYKKISTLLVINATDYDIKNKFNYKYVDFDFDSIFSELMNYLNKQEEIIKNSSNKNIFSNTKKLLCMIIGIDQFKSSLSDENKSKFNNLFTKAKSLGTIKFIIVDSIDKIKKFEFETWYKECVNTNYGIWVGNGINDQFSIKINQKIPEMKELIPNNFCFVITRGKAEYIKYVERFDISSKN